MDSIDFCTCWHTNLDWPFEYLLDGYEPDLSSHDVLEPVYKWAGKPPFYHEILTTSITLLKIRLLIDLQAFRRGREIAGPHVPLEILEEIIQFTASASVRWQKDIISGETLETQISKLERHIKILFDATYTGSKDFWPQLVHSKTEILETVKKHVERPGQLQAVRLLLYRSWVETPGAIGVIQTLIDRAGQEHRKVADPRDLAYKKEMEEHSKREMEDFNREMGFCVANGSKDDQEQEPL